MNYAEAHDLFETQQSRQLFPKVEPLRMTLCCLLPQSLAASDLFGSHDDLDHPILRCR